MNVIEKTKGRKVDYTVTGNKIVFRDDELSVNLAARERDDAMTVDVCEDCFGCLTLGVNTETRRYVAQVEIPPRAYVVERTEPEEAEPVAEAEDDKQQPGGMERINEIRTPVPFDIEKCTLILWGMEE